MKNKHTMPSCDKKLKSLDAKANKLHEKAKACIDGKPSEIARGVSGGKKFKCTDETALKNYTHNAVLISFEKCQKELAARSKAVKAVNKAADACEAQKKGGRKGGRKGTKKP
jgi:hypothetical protein